MRVKLVKIGNSWGVRLPKSVIVECGFKNELNLDIYQKTVVLSKPKMSRHGWSQLVVSALKDVTTDQKTAVELWEWNI